ncbi:hypothetical protein LTR37_008941, partial [Vermiconidia calcicola]
RARLASLYSDFRYQKNSNPDGYQANTNAWLRALIAGTKAGLIPSQSGAQQDRFVLHSGEELLRALQTQEYGRPLALGAAIEDAVKKKDLIQLKEFLDAKQSVYAKSWIPTPWQVVSWTLQKLGVAGGGSADDRLVAANFVVVANVEAAAKAVLDQASKIATSNTSRIFSRELFASSFSTTLETESISPTDLSVLLTHLSRDRSAISYSPTTGTIKFKAPSEPQPTPITNEHVSIAKLRTLMSSLEPQILQLTARVSQLDTKAREAVTNKQPTTAKAALRSKKLADTQLAQRNATLIQLEEVYAKIEQAADQVEIVRVMEASSQTLKSLNKQTGGVEKVQDVMDGLRDEMMSVDEIGQAINEVSAGEVDEGEVDDELEALENVEREKTEALERREREKREAEERKDTEKKEEEEAEKIRQRLAELDRVVQSGTPVSEQSQSGQKEAGSEVNPEQEQTTAT